MKILVLSFYFSPDLSAGSFRTTALVDQLAAKLPEGGTIDVLTTMPNRYGSFDQAAEAVEVMGAVNVRRIPIPRHSSDVIGQSKSFFRYWVECRRAVAGKQYDIVYATSSRLMTAFLGASLSRKLGAPLYLDIRDIFVDTISDVFSGPVGLVAKSVFPLVERMTMRRASIINLVSGGFEQYFKERYPDKPLRFFTNGIDSEFVSHVPRDKVASDKAVLTIVYAGNIGEGQCLHDIVPGLAKSLQDRAKFLVFGDGGRRQRLKDALVAQDVTNVEILDPVPREELIRQYESADVLFLHLGDYPAFLKVLPSKLFEYGALGKPVLAGIGGFSASFVENEMTNAAVFPPGDVDAGHQAFESLNMVTEPREGFVEKFRRDRISAKLADDIVGLFDGHCE